MKKITLIILIYLSGIFVAYPIGKCDLTNKLHRWQVQDRNVVISISILSWIGVGVFCGAIVIGENNSHEKADW